MEKKIYLVLTQTSSVLSSVIKFFTREEFNHISIALAPKLEPMYSFGRRRPYNPFFGGYVKEYPNQGTFKRFPKTVTCILELPVSDECYDKMKDVVEEMYATRTQYRYNFVGLAIAAFRIYYPRKNCYYCSEFARYAFTLAEIPGFEKLKKITSPCDFLSFPGVKPIYRGLLSEFTEESIS